MKTYHWIKAREIPLPAYVCAETGMSIFVDFLDAHYVVRLRAPSFVAVELSNAMDLNDAIDMLESFMDEIIERN